MTSTSKKDRERGRLIPSQQSPYPVWLVPTWSTNATGEGAGKVLAEAEADVIDVSCSAGWVPKGKNSFYDFHMISKGGVLHCLPEKSRIHAIFILNKFDHHKYHNVGRGRHMAYRMSDRLKLVQHVLAWSLLIIFWSEVLAKASTASQGQMSTNQRTGHASGTFNWVHPILFSKEKYNGKICKIVHVYCMCCIFGVLNYVQMFVFDFIQLFSASHGLKPRELQETTLCQNWLCTQRQEYQE